MRWRDDRRHRRFTIALALSAALLLNACADGGDSRMADRSGESRDDGVARAADTGSASGDGAAAVTARRAAAATGGFVVIRSIGPSAGGYAAGTRLAPDGVITLARGDRVVVTDGAQTRTLSGPGRFDLAMQTPATGNSVTTARDYAEALVEDEGRSVAAATRRTAAPPGSGGPRQPPSPINGATVQVHLPPTGTISPSIEPPRIVRPRLDRVAPRVDSNSIAAAPPAPDEPAAALGPSPAATVPQQARQQPQP